MERQRESGLPAGTERAFEAWDRKDGLYRFHREKGKTGNKRRLYDYLLCADGNNIRNTIMITGPDKDNKIRLLMDFAGKPGRSIADPWYTGRFDETYKDVVEGCEGLLDFLGLK